MRLLHVGAGVAAVVPQPGRSHGGDRTWSWKDDLHFEQQLYYGKIIAGQPSFLAPDYLPDFISALAGRDLEHERDVTRPSAGWATLR
jgi:hypothetical protein